MKTHNASIYHCVTCGRVVHTELGTEPPQCCGHAMAKAFTETVPDSNVAGDQAGDSSQTTPPVIKGPQKPR
ncbi:MAG: hypothetical protein HY290_29870 [Planctomycetia bacterium]|nr:hypothetical protein [Planctomycetia bacterium]